MWNRTDEQLSKKFTFSSFEQATEWMQNMVPFISKTNHHPEWKNVYNWVEVSLTTHDAGNTVTAKDNALADEMDRQFNALSK
ncbi:MAG: 4a-hydroxytetrahydrobiopterin dehydratase [Bacteroidia bacterium]|jgi:4a-hydroxytetrahydrobiopterin dehydratase